MGAYGGTAYASMGTRNQHPHVRLAPAIVISPDTVLCEAYAWDTDGFIQTVRWYSTDGLVLHEDSDPGDGWQFALDPTDAGEYTLWCIATDNQGGTVMSDTLTVPLSQTQNEGGR